MLQITRFTFQLRHVCPMIVCESPAGLLGRCQVSGSVPAIPRRLVRGVADAVLLHRQRRIPAAIVPLPDGVSALGARDVRQHHLLD